MLDRAAISTITDKVVEGMTEWQNRPLAARAASGQQGHSRVMKGDRSCDV